MLVEQTALPGVIILTPRTFGDDRGFFFESFNTRVFSESTGESCQFVQDTSEHGGLEAAAKFPVHRCLAIEPPNTRSNKAYAYREL